MYQKTKNDSTHQFCNAVHTWYILETIIYYDTIKWVVLCLITCTSLKTSCITILCNQSQCLSDVIEQWSCIVAGLQQVQVVEKMFTCVLLDETCQWQFWISTNSTTSVIRKLFSFVCFYSNNKAAAVLNPS